MWDEGMRKGMTSKRRQKRFLFLMGRVVNLKGAIATYTFEFERSREIFFVLLEVADRTIIGVAEYIFRQLCQRVKQLGSDSTKIAKSIGD